MSDLIDRKAAIDAFLTELTKRERKNFLHTWSTVEVKYFVADMLEKLPPAQPGWTKGVNDILAYLDGVVHPLVSPENWNVYSELHDMVSLLLKSWEGGQE